MASYNKTILMGNLTHDPELRHTPNGMAVTDLRLAINSKFKDKEEVLFIDATVWDKMAENCAKYLAKGKPVLVEGRLVEESWQDKESGQKRSKIKVVAQNVQFLGGKDEGRSAPEGNRRNSDPREDLNKDFDDGSVPF